MGNNKLLEKARDTIEENIKTIIKKGDNMTPSELDSLSKFVCVLEGITRIENDNSGEEYSGYYSEDSSHRRGRSATTGRFTSRDAMPPYDGGSYGYHDGGNSSRYYGSHNMSRNYSGHSRNDMTIYHIENLLDAAQTEQERQFLSEWLRRVKNN